MSNVRIDDFRARGLSATAETPAVVDPLALPGLQSYWNAAPALNGLIRDVRPGVGDRRSETSPSQQPGRAYKFDGISDWIGFSPTLSTSETWYCSLWVKFTGTSLMTPFSIRQGATTSHEQILIVFNISASQDLSLRVTGSALTIPATGINDGNWHHIAAYRGDGGMYHLFIDGVSVGEMGPIANPTTGVAYGTLGSNNNGATTAGQYYNGHLLDVRLLAGGTYSSADVQQSYIEGARAFQGQAHRIYYTCEDTHPNLSLDSSGNRLHGVKNGIAPSTFHVVGADVPLETSENVRGFSSHPAGNILRTTDDYALWTNLSGMTVTPGQTGYTGASTGVQVIPTASAVSHRWYHTTTFEAKWHATQFYFKPIGAVDRVMIANGSTGVSHAVFDLNALTFSVLDSSGAADATIENIGNGWYRCRAVDLFSAMNNSFTFSPILTSWSSLSKYGVSAEAGDGTSGGIFDRIQTTKGYSTQAEAWAAIQDPQNEMVNSLDVAYDGSNIPAATATTDALGGTLTYQGETPYDAVAKDAACGTFDGGNDHIVFPGADDGRFDFQPTDKLELECYLQTSQDGREPFGKMNHLLPNQGWGLSIDIGGYLCFNLIRSYTSPVSRIYFRGPVIDDGIMRHCRITYDGSGDVSGVRMFLDGVEVFPTSTVNSLNGTIDYTGRTFSVGARNASLLYYNGKMAGIKITKNDQLIFDTPIAEGGGGVVFDKVTATAGTIVGADLNLFWGSRQSRYFHNAANGYQVFRNVDTNAEDRSSGVRPIGFNIPPAGSWFETNLDYSLDASYQPSKSFDDYWDEVTSGLTVTTLYVDNDNGNDSTGDGLSWGTAWKTLNALSGKAAYTGADAVLLNIRGTFDYNDNNGNFADGYIVRVVGHDGAKLYAAKPTTDFTWTQDGTYPEVWSAAIGDSPRSGFSGQRLTVDGDPLPFSEQVSTAATAANEWSVYGGSTTGFMHVGGGVNPSSLADTWISLSAARCVNVTQDGSRVFLENVICRGSNGVTCGQTTTGHTYHFYAKGCTFGSTRYGVANAFATGSSDGSGKVRLYDCIAAAGGKDGFNWHAYSPATLDAAEFNCIARWNGEGTSDQGSSSHDDIKLVRANGLYHNNSASNITDIGGQVWNVGVTARNATRSDTSRVGLDFYNYFTAMKAWYYDCSNAGSTSNTPLAVDDTASVYVYGGDFTASDFVSDDASPRYQGEDRPPALSNGAESGIDQTGGVAFYRKPLPANLITSTDYSDSNFFGGSAIAVSRDVYPLGPTGQLNSYVLRSTLANGWRGWEPPVTLTAGKAYNFSVWLKRKKGSGVVQMNVDPYNGTWVTVPVTFEWQRFNVSHIPSATVSPLRVAAVLLGTQNDEIYVAQPQLTEEGAMRPYTPYGIVNTLDTNWVFPNKTRNPIFSQHTSDGSGNILSVDKMLVYDEAFIPSPNWSPYKNDDLDAIEALTADSGELLFDDFGSPNQSTLGLDWYNLNWNSSSNRWSIISKGAEQDVNGDVTALYRRPLKTADQLVEYNATLVNTSNTQQIFLRCDETASEGFAVVVKRVSPQTVRLFRIANNVASTLVADAALTIPGTNFHFKASIQGNTVRLFIDGAQVWSHAIASGDMFEENRYVGFRTAFKVDLVDNFKARDI